MAVAVATVPTPTPTPTPTPRRYLPLAVPVVPLPTPTTRRCLPPEVLPPPPSLVQVQATPGSRLPGRWTNPARDS